jgi:peroxiredoxin
VGISYDSVETLKAFSKEGKGERKVRFPLLSDPESEMIKAFGVLNQKFYEHYEKGSRFHGVPHPHLFLVDPKGRIFGKFAEKEFQNRPDITNILAFIEKTQNEAMESDRE